MSQALSSQAVASPLRLGTVDVPSVLGRRQAARLSSGLGSRVVRFSAGGDEGASLGAVAVSGSELIAATGPSGRLQVVDLADPAGATRVLGAHGSCVTALLPCGDVLFSAGSDGRALAWNLHAADRGPRVVGEHTAGLTAMVMVDGHLVTAGHDGHVLAWNWHLANVLATHEGGVESIAVLPSGALVTAGRDGRLLRWLPGSGERPVVLRQRKRELTLAMASLGRDALVTASGQHGVVRIWRDLTDGAWPERLGVHGDWVAQLLTLGHSRVAAVGGCHVTVWDLGSGAEERVDLRSGLHARTAVALETGDLAVSAADGSVQILEPVTMAS